MGLTTADAAARLNTLGPNVILQTARDGTLVVFLVLVVSCF